MKCDFCKTNDGTHHWRQVLRRPPADGETAMRAVPDTEVYWECGECESGRIANTVARLVGDVEAGFVRYLVDFVRRTKDEGKYIAGRHIGTATDHAGIIFWSQQDVGHSFTSKINKLHAVAKAGKQRSDVAKVGIPKNEKISQQFAKVGIEQ